MSINTDDLIGIPHVVILRVDGQPEVHQFEGTDCQGRAVEFAYGQLDRPGVDNIVIACRINTLSRSMDRIGTLHEAPVN